MMRELFSDIKVSKDQKTKYFFVKFFCKIFIFQGNLEKSEIGKSKKNFQKKN